MQVTNQSNCCAGLRREAIGVPVLAQICAAYTSVYLGQSLDYIYSKFLDTGDFETDQVPMIMSGFGQRARVW